MGFEDQAEDDEDKSEDVDPASRLYQEHFEFEEMVLGVKQGKYF